jgi:hypothetical protein
MVSEMIISCPSPFLPLKVRIYFALHFFSLLNGKDTLPNIKEAVSYLISPSFLHHSFLKAHLRDIFKEKKEPMQGLFLPKSRPGVAT